MTGKFYNWEKTLSYDADVTMVVGARGVGKTFGLRVQCVKDWLKDKSRFVEITRFKNELSSVADGYFSRVGEQFDNVEFRTDARMAYATFDTGDKKKKEWHVIGYFVALSDEQALKKRTFKDVRRIILDEAILDKTDRFHNYLVNEYVKLANVVDTVSRERKDTKSIRPRVYLLGNALDLANPYFAIYGVPTNVRYGYTWFKSKTFLLHYLKNEEYAKEKLTGTVAGRMLSNTQGAKIAIDNDFITLGDDFISKKPKDAKYMFGLVCNKHKFGVWCSYSTGFYYVTSNYPKMKDKNVYVLTADDYTVNYVIVKKADPVIKTFSEIWYYGLVRYDNLKTKTNFYEVLNLFGIK